MIEIVFSESACGSLKAAQSYGKGDYKNSGCTGVIISHAEGSKSSEQEIQHAKQQMEKQRRVAWEKAQPLGGNAADVYGFHLILSIGDISGNGFNKNRQKALETFYSIYPDCDEMGQVLFNQAEQTLKIILDRAAKGEDIRIWYSDQPDERCGFYWFMLQFSRSKNDSSNIYAVKLPEWEIGENDSVIYKTGWSEVSPAEWHRYIGLQKQIPPVLCKAYASRWQELQKENAPLRAVLNGQLVSVPENFYDDFILREIQAEKDEFHEAMIIGKVLGKYRLGISDAWTALRIEKLIQERKLEAVSTPEENCPTYHHILRKT